MKKFANFISKMAMKAAISAGGAASQWNVYQPVEPAALKQLLK